MTWGVTSVYRIQSSLLGLLPGYIMLRWVDMELLISLVQQRPSLWDTTTEEYKDRNLKDTCWEEVAQGVYEERWDNASSHQRENFLRRVKTKWRSARDQFRREYTAHQRGGAGELTKRPYIFYKLLLFLRKIVDSSAASDDISGTINEGPVIPRRRLAFLSSLRASGSNRGAFRRLHIGSTATRQRRAATSQRPGSQVDQSDLAYVQSKQEEDWAEQYCRSLANNFRQLPQYLVPQMQSAIATLFEACLPPFSTDECFEALDNWRVQRRQRNRHLAAYLTSTTAPLQPPTYRYLVCETGHESPGRTNGQCKQEPDDASPSTPPPSHPITDPLPQPGPSSTGRAPLSEPADTEFTIVFDKDL